jgi:hypothetical protein
MKKSYLFIIGLITVSSLCAQVEAAGFYLNKISSSEKSIIVNGFKDLFKDEFRTPPAGISGNLFFCSGGSTVLDAGLHDSYLWSTGSTNQTVTVNIAGVYSVTVTDLSVQTTLEATVVEFQNPIPIITGNASFCFGTGTVIDAGSGYQSYLWNNSSTNQTLSVNSSGTYTVTVADANSCSGSSSIQVIENQNPSPTITGNLSYCIGSSTVLDAGAGFATYLWNDGSSTQTLTATNPGDYTVTVTDINGCSGSSSVNVIQNVATATNISANGPLTFCDGDSVRLSADLGYSSYLWSNGVTSRSTKVFVGGTFTVTVTDANGCTSSSNATVIVNPNPTITDVDSTEVDCNGNFTGTFDVIASGGTGPYGYSINGVDFQETGLFTGLAYGVYTVTVVDSSSGCTSSKVKTVGQPDAITAFNITQDNLCYGEALGSIDLTVDGGVEPYSYLWSNGSTAEDPDGLVSDVYTVTVTDANNCTFVNVYEILEPSQITVGTQQTNISCSFGSDGTAFVDVNGGTPGYTYLWSDGQTDAFAFGLSVGVHSVTITDFNGCDTIMNFTITQPSQLNTTSIENNVSCFGANDGSISVSPYGGTPYTVGDPYEIEWNTIPIQFGATATGLSAGVYTALIVDSAGCIKYHVVTINEPSKLIIGMSMDPVNCSGGNDGEATANVIGGTPAYSFLWDNGQTTATATGLVAGTYSVTVTDIASCTATATVVITQPSAISVNGVVDDVKCNGATNGKITLSVSGGTGVYSYLWNTNPSRTTKNLNNVTAGTYSVVVTDNSGCSIIQTFTINQPAVLACNGIVTNTNCNGGATGSIVISPSGGTAPYTILWSNGSTTYSNQNLLSGSYTVTITDSKNCVVSCNYNVAVGSGATINGLVQNVTCSGAANGTINVNLIGGNAPFIYLWSNGATTLSISGLVSGSYTLTVTDVNSCTKQATFLVTEPSALSCICNANVVNVSCFGGNDGSITAQPIGGTAPYSYLWSNGAMTQTITGLGAGTYTVTITDANGCQKIGLVQVSQPAQLFAVISCLNNSTCYGINNGSACVNGTGGTFPYSYSWNSIPVQTTFTATGLSAGTYIATVTDNKGCTATASVTVAQPSSSLSCTTTQTNVVCFGQSNGQATSFPTGGTGPYSYLWNTIPAKTTKTVLGLKAGAYTVIVTDASGCTCSSVVTIGQPPQLLALSSATNVSCYGGSNGAIDITVTGGTPSYTYNWSNGATTQDISNLTAGTYQVTITDSKGCIAIVNVVLIQPNLLSCSTGSTNVSCNAGNNGSAFVIVTGGSAPYSYLWSNGGINANENGLSAGTYTVTVTDSKGCTTTCSAIVTQPLALGCSVNILSNVTCGANNGKLQVTATGGTPNYSFLWSTIPLQTSAIATGLAPGSYSVLVTDAKGCTTICSANLGSSTTVSCNVTGTNVSCNGGSNGTATVNPSGGSAPYTYLWNTLAAETTSTVSGLTAGTYIAIVTDNDGCTSNCSIIITEPSAINVSISSSNVTCGGGNDGTATENPSGGVAPYTYLWNNGATTQTILGLVIGTYTVTVTDANGCIKQDAVVITQPVPISCNTTATDVSCNGGNNGTVSVVANGGTMPLTYIWNTNPSQSTTTATGLFAGTYTVTITDANGCSQQCSATVNQASSTLACLVSVVNDVNCYNAGNGSLMVTATGGTGLYTYNWNTSPTQTSATATGLIAGNYSVIVTDANGCTTTCFGSVTEPAALTCSVNSIQSTCGLSNGSLSVVPIGGTPGYSFMWSNGSTDQSIAGLVSGTFTVTVTDVNGCTSSCNASISGSSAIIFTTTSSPVTCNSACNGTGSVVNALGGTPPYSYLWSDGSTNLNATSLCSGVYTVTVSDNAGCSSTSSITINEPSAITVTISDVVNVACNGGFNGQAKVNPIGGTPSYNYLWSNSSTNQSATGLSAGTYTVTVTDQNGCTVSDNVVINQSGALTYQQNQTNVLCFGLLTGSATVTPSGGTVPYSYLWSNSQTNQTATGLAAGNYTVIISDNNGCSIIADFDIIQPSLLTCGVSQSNPKCNQSCDGFATAVINGGTPNYTFVWSDGQTNQTATGLCSGTYTVTTQDLNGCTTSCSVTLVNPDLLSCNVLTSSVTCFGLNNGTATATAQGGTAPFDYAWSDGQTTQTASGLSPASYTVTITDQNGCSTTCSGLVTEPIVLSVTISNVVDATCGLNNGSAQASAFGGSVNYNYNWSNGQPGASLVNVGPGTYTVTVTDLNQCSATQSVVIIGTTELNGIISGNNLSCFADNSGSASISVSGGDGNYTYQWNSSPIQTTQTATGLSAQQYVVLVTDGNGCTVADSTTLSEPQLLSCNASGSPGGCGLANGTATVTATGGTLPYNYLWSNGSTLINLTNLAPGTYTVTVTDGNSCTTSCSAIVTGGPKINNVDLDVTKVSCFGGSDGSICVVLVNGGTAPYSYLWSNGASTICLTNKTPGTYTVTVTDVNGCTFVISGQIIQPSLLTCSTILLSNANCNSSDGSAKVLVTGGTPVYSRVWNTSPVQTLATATGLSAGTYTVTVTDKKGCTTSCSVTISSVNNLACSTSKTNPTCSGGSNGQATVTVTGAGIYTLSYLWSNGQTTQTATGLLAGTYTVTATASSGCSTSCFANITQPVANSCLINVVRSPKCGQCNGRLKAIPVGGTAPYTYIWNTTPVITTATLNNVCAGTYLVTITDSKGCTSQCSINLTATLGPVCNITGNTTICQGSSTQLCAPVGLSSYLWSTGASTQCIAVSTGGTYSVTVANVEGCTSNCSATVTVNPAPICSVTGNTLICDGGSTQLCAPAGMASYLWSTGETTECITANAAGSYSVTITNAAGCTSNCSATVTTDVPPLCSISGNTSICDGGSTQLCAPAGMTSYLWSTGASTQCITALAAGSYSVTVTNAAGCTSNCNTTVTIDAAPICNISGNTSICDGGSTELCAPTGMISYLWSTGASTQCLTVTTAGSYSVTITNTAGCTSNCNATVTTDAAPVCSISGNTSICEGGSTQLCAPLGMSSYLWSTGASTQCITVTTAGSYSVTITNAVGCTSNCNTTVTVDAAPTCNISGNTSICNGGSTELCALAGMTTYLWSTGASTQCITVTTAGSYSVTITNAAGCTSNCNTTVTVDATPACNISGNTSICSGGSTELCATSGMTSYLWSTGASTQCITVTNTGSYSVTITNASGCTSNCNVSVTSGQAPFCTISGNTTICDGSSTQLCAATGMASYLWSTGASTQCITATNAGDYSVTITNAAGCSSNCSVTVIVNTAPVCSIIQNGTFCAPVATPQLCATNFMSAYLWSTGATTRCLEVPFPGTFTVTITNSFGCTASCSQIVSPGTPITNINITKTNVTCFGANNGSACANTITGGNAPFTYNWSSGSSNACINNLAPGTYTVTVTDVNGCTQTKKTTVTEPVALINCNISDFGNATCSSCNGFASVNATGGTPEYTYSWNTLPIQSSATATGLCAGTYFVTISDINGCTTSCSVNISSDNPISCSITPSPTNCFGGANGSATVSVNGSGGPFTYLWSNGQTNQTATALAAETYTVSVTSSNGCTTSCSTVINQPSQIVIVLGNVVDVSCNGGSNGSASVSASGGTGSLTYLWSNGSTNTLINNLTAGTYTVTTTDLNGCSATQSITVSQPEVLVTPTASLTLNPTCFEACNGSITLNSQTGGTAPYNYLWSNGATTSLVNQLCAGTYTVTVIDANSCSVSASFTVSQPNVLSTVTSQTNVSSCNNTDGTASVTPSGGTPVYSYSWSNGSSTSSISALAAGIYAVTVTDANGCSVTTSVTLTQPAYVCSTFVSGHKQTYYSPKGCAGCDTIKNYAIANFGSAFPSGLTIGCSTGFNIQFTNINAVLAFLPSANSSAALTQNYIDPLPSPLDNGFASQLATLAMTIRFDLTDPNFAPTSTVNFKDLIVDSVGPWNGKTVQEIFDEGQRQLGGCTASFTITKSQLSTITSRINSSWDLGNQTSTFLKCPPNTCDGAPKMLAAEKYNDSFDVTAYPNPTDDKLNLSFIAATKSHYSVKMMDMKGGLVLNQEHESVVGNNILTYNLNSLPKGLYMIQIIMGDQSKTIKVVLK